MCLTIRMWFSRTTALSNANSGWHAIVAVSTALLVVVHVYREDDANGEEIIRIISAREANQRERRIYIQQTAQ